MAVTVEYGKCAQCSADNPKALNECRSCGAALPWAKAAKAPSDAGPGVGDALSQVAWGPMAVQILGGLIFVAGVFFWFGNVLRFFPTFPGVGYIVGFIGAAIWKAGASME